MSQIYPGSSQFTSCGGKFPSLQLYIFLSLRKSPCGDLTPGGRRAKNTGVSAPSSIVRGPEST